MARGWPGVHWLGVLALALAAGAGACLRSPSFACDEDVQCQVGGQGTCEATGYCSFPDDGCPSGRRFGDGAGTYAGQCVVAEVDAAVLDAPIIDAPITDAAIDGAAIGCPDPATATSFPVGQACNGWGTPFRASANVQNGGAGLLVTPNAATAGARAGCDHVAVPFGAAGVLTNVDRVVVGAGARTRLELGAAAFALGVESGSLVASVGDAMVARRPYQADAMGWWRIRPTAGVVFEVSADGRVWDVVATAPVVPPPSVTIRVVGETVQAVVQPGTARFRSVNLCP